MDKIKSLKNFLKVISVKHLFIIAFFLCYSPILWSQNQAVKKTGKKKIELIYAELQFIIKDPQTGKDLYRFLGKVNIKHNEVIMWCDSAHYSPDRNQVEAFSKIHIEQGDSLDLFGDYLFYDGKLELGGGEEQNNRKQHNLEIFTEHNGRTTPIIVKDKCTYWFNSDKDNNQKVVYDSQGERNNTSKFNTLEIKITIEFKKHENI